MDDGRLPDPGTGPAQAVTARVVRALEEAGFIVSAKSTLDPGTEILFLGKYINLGIHTIRSHQRAILQMPNIWLHLATRSRPSSRLLSKAALGFIHWHFRPQLWGPLLAGSYCCDRGGGGSSAPRPESSMAYAQQLSYVWNHGSHPRWHALQFTIRCQLCLICGRCTIVFGDAALDANRYRGGGGGGASYRGCLEFVHRLYPRSGTRSRVRSSGCWCGWCGWL